MGEDIATLNLSAASLPCVRAITIALVSRAADLTPLTKKLVRPVPASLNAPPRSEVIAKAVSLILTTIVDIAFFMTPAMSLLSIFICEN